MTLSPLMQRRLQNFKRNRRGYICFWLFLIVFILSLLANVIANDKPLLMKFNGQLRLPILHTYYETDFGGDFAVPADYRDPYIAGLIRQKGWMVMPPIPYSYQTINYDLPVPAPAPPSRQNWLGTDDQGRDVLARLIYGFRISILFGLILTFFGSILGVLAGAVQGYFGGWVDLVFQRFIEIWSGIPILYLLIIMASIVQPSFWRLLILMLFAEAWLNLVGLVRAEFYRVRNMDYVRAARALGCGNWRIMTKHILPNALVTSLSRIAFILTGAITTLTALDFLGFGLPPGSASLGELLSQGKNNLQAPWLGFTGFIALGGLLLLLTFIGEAVRDAFDPRKHQ